MESNSGSGETVAAGSPMQQQICMCADVEEGYNKGRNEWACGRCMVGYGNVWGGDVMSTSLRRETKPDSETSMRDASCCMLLATTQALKQATPPGPAIESYDTMAMQARSYLALVDWIGLNGIHM
eukprot:1155801-Pelagomonas_calceolata.AAC.1